MDYRGEIRAVFQKRWLALSQEHAAAIPVDPGIYLISNPQGVLAGQSIRPEQIYYVGMTVSAGGLRSRLGQFLKATRGLPGHSGGRRFHQLTKARRTLPDFSVAFLSYPAKVRKELRAPQDLELMGHVACLEYFMLAYIKQKCGREPSLNRK